MAILKYAVQNAQVLPSLILAVSFEEIPIEI